MKNRVWLLILVIFFFSLEVKAQVEFVKSNVFRLSLPDVLIDADRKIVKREEIRTYSEFISDENSEERVDLAIDYWFWSNKLRYKQVVDAFKVNSENHSIVKWIENCYKANELQKLYRVPDKAFETWVEETLSSKYPKLTVLYFEKKKLNLQLLFVYLKRSSIYLAKNFPNTEGIDMVRPSYAGRYSLVPGEQLIFFEKETSYPLPHFIECEEKSFH